jgi:hypothetical protein
MLKDMAIQDMEQPLPLVQGEPKQVCVLVLSLAQAAPKVRAIRVKEFIIIA